MQRVVYISHPQVAVDPDLAVDRWSLSDVGLLRARVAAGQTWLRSVRRIVSSSEVKAVETAAVLAGGLGLEVEVRDGIGEMNRSSTGFVPPAEFEALADAFFADPAHSVRGWERAVDAQRRVVAGLADLLTSDEDVAVVGHGGVGTLWWCHLAGVPISRRWDQPSQGNFFVVDTATSRPLRTWQPIDDLATSPGGGAGLGE
ncbi:MAG: histidine phosphatase family protein [Ilumatobacteraceae bacterium]